MTEEDRLLYRTVYSAYERLSKIIEDSLEKVTSGEKSIEELADFIFVAKQASQLLDENAKKLRGVLDTGKKVLCLRWVNSNYNGDNIKTEYVTATPKVTSMPVLPTGRKQPEDYAAFCAHFGIRPDLIENDSFRPHWPGMKKQIEDDAMNGKPLPPGCDPSKTYPAYDVLLRKRKGVLED